MRKSTSVYRIDAGKAAPLGATVNGQGVNFSIYSKHATAAELVFFSDKQDIEPGLVFRLDGNINRTSYYWHIYVHNVNPGQLYAWIFYGPVDKKAGHRFDSDKYLLDPYSKAIIIPDDYNRKFFATLVRRLFPV
jgi:glycogen operon protein